MSAKHNGQKVTVAALAHAKKLPIEHLEHLGLRDTPRGVAVPYYAADGAEIAVKERTALTAKDGSYWPKGVELAAYGSWKIGEANKAGILFIVEGESDCWTLWHHSLPALGIPGANAAKVILLEHVEAVGAVYVTGNNVAIAADTARRICHVRLESPEERPEERQDFQHPNLLAWVGEQRATLLAAALTILRAYCAAGRPDQHLPAWGSFEGWSGLVRSAVVWVGLPDPGETRLLLQAQADVAAESMGVLLDCWERLDPDQGGLTAAEVIHRVYKEPPTPLPDFYADLRDALEALLGKPDARGLGNRLRTWRRT